MKAKKKAKTSRATEILFDRYYRGKPERIAQLKRTRQELARGRKIRALRESRGLMKHPKKKIHVKLVGRDADTAYISLMGHRPGDKKWAKMRGLPVKGAMVNLDFDKEDRLIGVEIIVWESDWLEDDRVAKMK